MSTASITNSDGVVQPRGSIVRSGVGPNTCLLALADTLAHCQHLIGTRLANVDAGSPGPVGELSDGSIVLLDGPATAGDTIYLSASFVGQGTNVAPTIKVILGVAYQVFSITGTYYAQLLIPARHPSATRIWEVGQGNNQYPTIQAALDAIAADPVPPSQDSPAEVKIYPGKYTSTSTLGIPAWTSVRGTDRFAVQLYNETTDLLRCDGNNVSISQLTFLASATNLWAILGNNKVNVWIQDIYFSTNSGTGTQGLLYCTGGAWSGIRFDRLWASTRMTSGYVIVLENTSANARDVGVQFENLMAINQNSLITPGAIGGILLIKKCQGIRLVDIDFRLPSPTVGKGISHELDGAVASPTLTVMSSFGSGGNPIYTEVGTTVTIDNSSFSNSSINGASTIRNSTV